jgi:phage terminase large subunit-like protein
LDLQLLPWQRQAFAVGLERAGRRPAYRDVLLSVPRQSAKSTSALVLIVHKLLSEPDQLVLYSAQNRVAARRKLLHTWWPRIVRSELAPRFKLFRGFGNEMLSCDNGSRLELLSATESSGHGESCDLAWIDESWVHLDALIEQSIRPTLATRDQAQLWISSSAGTAKSLWWRGKLDAARTAAELGTTTGTALLEWAASPEQDPADEQTWWGCMPALGRLIDVATVRADLHAMGVSEFKRAFLNLWPDEGEVGWAVVGRELWEASRL